MPLGAQASRRARTTESEPGSQPAEMTDTPCRDPWRPSSDCVQLPDLGVDVKAVHGVDAFGKIEKLGVFLYRAGRQAQQGNLRLDRQLVDVVDNGDCQASSFAVCAGVVANHADQLHILSGLDGLKGVMSDISISDNDYLWLFPYDTVPSIILLQQAPKNLFQ